MQEESLKNKTVKGVGWSAVDNVAQYAISFVADYTNQTQSARGVEIAEQAPRDIEFFHLANPRSILFRV